MLEASDCHLPHRRQSQAVLLPLDYDFIRSQNQWASSAADTYEQLVVARSQPRL